MSNPNQLSEPDPGQPNHIDQSYDQLDIFTRWLAEAIASGARDPSAPIPTGDLSTLPPKLRELILQWEQEALQEHDQTDNNTPPPTDTPPSPETPQ